jgi:hypothetical protein
MPTFDLSRLLGNDDDHVEIDLGSKERFDRIAFALEAVDIARPARMTVAVCAGSRKLRVESGRTWGRGPYEAWAVVHVPKTASREAIAFAVSDLLGRAHASATAPEHPGAYALDTLLARAKLHPSS